MKPRHRLKLAPERAPRPARGNPFARDATPIASEHVVLSLSGDERLTIELTHMLVRHAHVVHPIAVTAHLSEAPARLLEAFGESGACSTLDAGDSFVGARFNPDGVRAWLGRLPRGAWVIAAGDAARAMLEPTFSLTLGARYDAAAPPTDLWLGQSSEPVAAALVDALRAATKGVKR